MPLSLPFFCAYWQYGVTGFCRTGKWRTIKKRGGICRTGKCPSFSSPANSTPATLSVTSSPANSSPANSAIPQYVILYWYFYTDISLLRTEALHHRCPTISTSRLAQSVVTYPVVVRDAGWRGKVSSRLTSSLLNALAACSDFRCMPVFFPST